MPPEIIGKQICIKILVAIVPESGPNIPLKIVRIMLEHTIGNKNKTIKDIIKYKPIILITFFIINFPYPRPLFIGACNCFFSLFLKILALQTVILPIAVSAAMSFAPLPTTARATTYPGETIK